MSTSADHLADSVSVVVPVHNSADSLPALADRLGSILPDITAQYELLLVNDGSRDSSWDVIRTLSGKHSWIRGICLMRNYGQHNALLAGIRAARNDVIVTMDDDLQHPPEEIHKLLGTLNAGCDVAYGTPDQEQHGVLRNIASQITKVAMQGAMGADTARNVSAFRAFRREVRDAFTDYRGPFISIDVLLTWGTSRFAAVPVRHEPREAGKSGYRLRTLVTHAVNMMTGFSVLPLQIASLIGLVFALFGFLILIFVIACFFVAGRVVPGFAFLASMVAIFSGVQLLSLGVIGEYLARIHYRTMDRPSYAIREQTE